MRKLATARARPNTALRMPWPILPARSIATASTCVSSCVDAFARAAAWAEEHTGVPAIVVAAVALLVGFRVFKRSLRFALEVAVVVGLLGLVSALGWVRF